MADTALDGAPAPPTDGGKNSTSPLPATAEEVTDQASFTLVIQRLTAAISKATYEGKSVTAANKRFISSAAEEIRRATNALSRVWPAEQQPQAITEGGLGDLSGVKNDLLACMRAEMSKLKAELVSGGHHGHHTTTARHPNSTITTTAATGSQSYAQALGSRPSRRAEAPPTPPPIQRQSRPAIIVTAKGPADTRQEAVAAWRKSISFKECRFAPVSVRPISNNKLRVEFESSSQRDDTLHRLRGSNEVSAEPARSLHPMVVVKGIDKDTPAEDLAKVILTQNPSLEDLGDDGLRLRFKRNNRNPNLYNAVFTVTPKAFRAVVELGRVCIDHQRVHVEEFSPFLQCYCCLQFGHIRKNCPTKEEVCAFCAGIGHGEAACPTRKLDDAAVRCHNCVGRNAKFQLNTDTKHNAKSNKCPVLRAMKARVEQRISYGE